MSALKNINVLVKDAVHRKILYAVIAVISVIAAITVFFVLERPGIAMTYYDENGIVTIPEGTEPVKSGSCDTDVEYKLYGDEENGYTVVFSPAEGAESCVISKKISSLLADECDKIVAVKLEDGIVSLVNSWFMDNESVVTFDASECKSLSTIGMYAFKNCSSLKHVVLSDDNMLESINDQAFVSCSSLTDFSFDKLTRLTSIGNQVFNGCSSLTTEVDLSGCTELESIGNYAFSYCAFENVNLSGCSKLSSIVNGVFGNCASLKSVDLTGCTAFSSVGDYAFSKCTSLEAIDLSDNTQLTSIGNYAFQSCTSLKDVNLSGCTSLETIGSWAFNTCSSLKDVNLSGCTSLKTIGLSAFNTCSSLKSIDLSVCTNLETINQAAFQLCSAMETIYLPDNTITSLGFGAFDKCYALTSFPFEKLNSEVSIGRNCFYSCRALKKADLSSLDLTEIPEKMFADCTSLETVILPDKEKNKITSIGGMAFFVCPSLKSINLEDCTLLEIIRNEAFVKCTSLETVDLSGCTELEKIGSGGYDAGTWGGTFSECTSLKTVDLSGCTNLKLICVSAFSKCSKLEKVILPENSAISSIGTNAFLMCGNLYDFDFTKLTNLKSLGAQTFYNCSSLKTLDLSQCTSLDFTTNMYSVFVGCSGVETVVFPPQITVIPATAFNSTSIKTISFPEGSQLATIGPNAFGSCTSLTSVDLSNTVISTIDDEAFKDDKNLETIIYPENCLLTSINFGVFSKCYALKNINLEDLVNLETIGDQAFYKCYSLKELDFSPNEKLSAVGTDAFTDCNSLTRLSFAGCTELVTLGSDGSQIVASCENLKEIDLSGCTSLEKLPDNIFENTSALETLKLDGCTSLSEIGTSALAGCTSLKTIDIVSSLTAIGDSAYENCYNVSAINYNAQNLTSVGADAFKNVGMLADEVTVNVSASVDTVCENVFNSDGLTISKVLFEGINESLYIGKDAFASVGEPLTSMSDGVTEYYVDEYGVVYSKDKTTLYYIPSGIKDYTIPESVTTVKASSCAMADDLESLTFENISNITKVEALGFANAHKLGKIISGDTIATTVSDAEAMFTAGTLLSNVFYNTALEGSITGTLTGEKLTDKTYIGGTETDENTEFSLTVTFDTPKDEEKTAGVLSSHSDQRIPSISDDEVDENKYYYLTNESAVIFISYDSKSSTENKIGRVYIQPSSGDAVLPVKVGESKDFTYNNETYNFNLKKVEGTDVYYFEFDLRNGTTLSANHIQVSFPNLGGDQESIKIWCEIVESTDSPVISAPTDYYQEAVWYTAIQQWSVSGTLAVTNTSLKSVANDDSFSKRVKNDITYTIKSQSTGNGSFANGADPVRYFTFTDTVELPQGMAWEDEILESVQNGTCKIIADENGGLTVSALTSDGYVELFKLTAQSGYPVCDAEFEIVDGKLVISWKVRNTKFDTNEPLVPDGDTYNNWEIDNLTQTLKINADEIIKIVETGENQYDFDSSSIIKNSITQEVTYLYRTDDETDSSDDVYFTQSDSDNVNVAVSKANLEFKKTMENLGSSGTSSKGVYGGESVIYTIKIANSGVLNYEKLTSTNDFFTTTSDDIFYGFKIEPENIDKMFFEDTYKELTITILNGYVMPVGDEERQVTGMNGETVIVDPVDVSKIEYIAETDSDGNVISYKLKEGDENLVDLTIKWSEDKSCIQVSVGKNTYMVGENQEYASVEQLMDAIGFFDLAITEYRCTWNYEGDRQILYASETRVHNLYARAKNSFEKISDDTFESKFSNAFNNSSTAIRTNSNNVNLALLVNGVESSTTKSFASDISWQRDYALQKQWSVNGENLPSGGDSDKFNALTSGSVIDYTIVMKHYGNSQDYGVPLNDHLRGAQTLMVTVSGNEDKIFTDENGIKFKLSQADLEIYTDDNGTKYYLLSKPGTYEDVLVGDSSLSNDVITSDRIVVSKTGSGLYTSIYWYYDIVDGTKTTNKIVTDNIKYKAMIRDDLNGSVSDEPAVELSSIVYLNEREHDNIYYPLSGQYRTYSFDKQIVTSNAGLENETTAERSDIDEGENVIYKITLVNNSEKYNIPVYDIYDLLPQTYDLFEWNKSNVKMYTISSLGANSTADKWKIVHGANENDVDRYYIYWNDSADSSDKSGKIVLKPKETLSIYITLTYPDNMDGQETWDKYRAAVRNDGGSLYNYLFANNDSKYVTHAIKDKGEVSLQKGVYGIYSLGRNIVQNNSSSQGTQLESRTEYTNSAADKKIVTYYVAIYNSGYGTLYLTDIYDTLPEGYSFVNLCAVTDDGSANKTADYYYSSNGYTAFRSAGIISNASSKFLRTYSYNSVDAASDSSLDTDNLLAIINDPDIENIEYVEAYVKATVDSSDSSKIKFEIDRTFNGSEDENSLANKTDIGYDETAKLCYLKRGQAVVFGYTVEIGGYADTDDIATNTIGMQYYDYNGAGVVAADDVSVKGQYNDYSQSRNDGTQKVVSDDDISEYGFEGSYSSQWLVSDVSLVRGNIIPGASKALSYQIDADGNKEGVVDEIVDMDSSQIWSMKLVNDGTNTMYSYTIRDVMENPYVFNGDITYYIYDSITKQFYYPAGYSTDRPVNNDDITLIDDVTFNFIGTPVVKYSERDNITVSFNTRYFTEDMEWAKEAHTVKLGEEIECTFGWRGNNQLYGFSSSTGKWFDHYCNYKLKIKFDIDENNQVFYEITFESSDESTSDSQRLEDSLNQYNQKVYNYLVNYSNANGVTSIPAYGGYAVMGCITKNPTNNSIVSNFINKVQLLPEDSFDEQDVTLGSIVSDSDGNAVGVQGAGMFLTRGSDYTNSWKTVTSGSKTASSKNEDNNYIVLGSESEVFTFDLYVSSFVTNGMEKLIVIDNLPELNDHMAYSSDDVKRNSQFGVMLDSLENITVNLIYTDDYGDEVQIPVEKTTDESVLGYTVEFSTVTNFSSYDWSGLKTVDDDGNSVWMTAQEASEKIENNEISLSDIRAFRVIITGGNGVENKNTVKISVPAKINGDALQHTFAWNNFGYKYYYNNGASLSASSLTVGVMTTAVPEITKTLNSLTVDDISAEELGINARFIVYEGSQLTYTDEQDLFRQLYENGTAFSVAMISGKEIDSGQKVALKNLNKYKVLYNSETGEYSYLETDDYWSWDEGTVYTVSEIEISQNVMFSKMNNSQTNAYSFAYKSTGNYLVECENLYDDYNLRLTKLAKSTGKTLSGAGFARYGIITLNVNDENYSEKLEEIWREYVDEYIEAVKEVSEAQDNDRFTLSTVGIQRLEGAINSFEGFTGISGVKSEINSLSDIGDDFCQLYIMDNGDDTHTIYYFIEYRTSDENGEILYEGLTDEMVGILETAAPEGFKLDHRMYVQNRTAQTGATQSVNIINEQISEFPATGGNGGLFIILTGTALMLFATVTVIIRLKKSIRSSENL